MHIQAIKSSVLTHTRPKGKQTDNRRKLALSARHLRRRSRRNPPNPKRKKKMTEESSLLVLFTLVLIELKLILR